MKVPSRQEQQRLVAGWQATGRELEKIRRTALRGMPYVWADADALLDIGCRCPHEPRLTSGLVEMQYWFMKATRR